MSTIALFGAAGKIGTRIANRLRELKDERVLYVEAGEGGIARLRERGFSPTPVEVAAKEADVIILAIPDTLIGKVASEIVPLLKSGALIICLDPAAPYGGELPARADIAYFITHPCHPPVVNDEETLEARRDFYGGVLAKQSVVCALMQGSEQDYVTGERIVRLMFAPVMRTHRVTVEQMAILEPALSESLVLTAMVIMREAMDEVVRLGVPEAAVWDFVLGHININIGILFGYADAKLSDGAKMAVERARTNLFQPDWKKVFETDRVMAEVKAITQGRAVAAQR
jgi:D-apionate oxidoisomerase